MKKLMTLADFRNADGTFSVEALVDPTLSEPTWDTPIAELPLVGEMSPMRFGAV